MAIRETIEEKPVTLATVKKILKARKKEGELTYEQKLALEYAKSFAKTSEKKAIQMVEKLCELERIKPEHAVKIVDLMPKDVDEVRLIFAKERFSLKEEDIKKILEIVG